MIFSKIRPYIQFIEVNTDFLPTHQRITEIFKWYVFNTGWGEIINKHKVIENIKEMFDSLKEIFNPEE